MRRRLWKAVVLLDSDARPISVLYRGHYRVVNAYLDNWEWAGEWWAQVFPREYWLLELQGDLIVEVYQISMPDLLTPEVESFDAPEHFDRLREVGTWVVARIFD